MLLILVYFGVASSLLGANCLSQTVIESELYIPFHMAEFWSAFLFALLEAFILLASNVLSVESTWQKLQVLLVGFNVVATLTPALLFIYSSELLEVPAHYMEYGAQITIAATNFIFISQQVAGSSNSWRKFRVMEFVFAMVVFAMAILKLLFFVPLIEVEMEAERASHFFEFIGEMANSLFALLFAFLMFLDLERRIKEHKLDTERD
jgi:hypothetical protein